MPNDNASFDVVAYTNCVNFAAIKHKNQRRKDPDKTPYINHPVGTCDFHIFEFHDFNDEGTLMNFLQALPSY